MSNVYLKVTVEKKWNTQNFDFLSLKSSSPGQTHTDIIEFSDFLLQLKNQRSGSKTLWAFSIILILKGIMKF